MWCGQCERDVSVYEKYPDAVLSGPYEETRVMVYVLDCGHEIVIPEGKFPYR